MSKKAIIERTIKAINQLPNEKGEEIADFIDFVLKKYEEEVLLKGIQQLLKKAVLFNFQLKKKIFIQLMTLKFSFVINSDIILIPFPFTNLSGKITTRCCTYFWKA